MSDVQPWHPVCPLDALTLDRGVAALVCREQVAVFRTSPDGALYALGNRDPGSGAPVLARGIVGSEGDVTKVASPMYKHTFDLRTGRGLSDPSLSVPTFPVRVRDGWVEVAVG